MQSTPDEDEQPGHDNWPADPAQETRRGISHFVILALLLISAAAIVALGLWSEPDARGFGTHEQLGLDPCQMLAATGVPCPACGVTTSVALAAQGQVSRSFLTQPLGLLLAFGVPLLTLWALLLHLRGVDLYARFERRRAPWVRVFLVLVASAWIYKIAASV